MTKFTYLLVWRTRGRDIAVAGSTTDFAIRYGNDLIGIRNGLSGSVINSYEFADGTVLDHAGLMARGFDVRGGDGAETLTGTSEQDRIAGGKGRDTLIGGMGADTYLVNAGDGRDTIDDRAGENNVLRLGAGLDPDTLTVMQSVADDGHLYLDLAFAGGEVLRVRNGELGSIGSLLLADGRAIDYRALLSRLAQVVAFGSAADDLVTGACDPIPYAWPMTMAMIPGFEMKTESAAMLAENENQWRQTA